MRPGMVFTIEPAIIETDSQGILWPDNFTVATDDDSWGAQFEETVAITNNGVEILTKNEW